MEAERESLRRYDDHVIAAFRQWRDAELKAQGRSSVLDTGRSP
jgi:hypothetical protein